MLVKHTQCTEAGKNHKNLIELLHILALSY